MGIPVPFVAPFIRKKQGQAQLCLSTICEISWQIDAGGVLVLNQEGLI
jgi:hypothetical protein